jgi:hypothetical protein
MTSLEMGLVVSYLLPGHRQRSSSNGSTSFAEAAAASTSQPPNTETEKRHADDREKEYCVVTLGIYCFHYFK